MNKRIPQLLGILALVTTMAGAAIAADGGSTVDDNPSVSDLVENAVGSTTSTTSGTTSTTSAGTAGAVDISGPCDEVEHAGDPRCTGGVDDRSGSDDSGLASDGAEDISGPCDEAEHAGDPRCAGGQDDDSSDDDGFDDDHSGKGSDDLSDTGDDSGRRGGDDSGHRGGDDD